MAKYAQLTATGLPHGVLLTIQDSTGKQVSNLYPEADANAPDNRARFADGTGAISPATYVPNGTYIVAYSGGSKTVVVSGGTGTPADSMFVDLATQAELNAAEAADSATYVTAILPQKYGALGDGQEAGDGSMTAASAVLTSPTAAFVAGDVGKSVIVVGAGVSGGQLTSTIVSRESATQVTLADAAGTTVTTTTIAWATNDTAALDLAFAEAAGLRTGTIVLNPGGYFYNGTGLASQYPRIKFAAGEAGATVYLGTGKSLVVSPAGPSSIKGMHIQDPRTVGGFGLVRLSYTGANSVAATFRCERVSVNYFTGCGISALSSDTPFWKISGTFLARNADGPIGVALSGLNDDCDINAEFHGCRVDVKLARGGNNARVRGAHISLGAYPGWARVPVWLTPHTSATNAGDGFVCTDFKFGNENYDSRDYRLLLADEDSASGADFATRFPKLDADSTGFIVGLSVHNVDIGGAGGTPSGPVVYSTTPNVRGLHISGALTGTLPNYIMQFRTAPGADRTTQDSVVGPFYGGDLATETTVFPPISNAAGWGRAIDPAGLFATRDTEPLMQRAGDPVDYVKLLATAVRSFTLGGGATRSNVADVYGGTDAAEVTFGTGSLTYAGLTTANITAGVPAWIEFDVKAGSSSPLTALRLFAQYTGSGAIHFRRVFSIPASGWVRYRFLFVPREKTTTINLGFDPNGVAGAAVIGRVRCYHSREPQNVDGYLLAGGTTPQLPVLAGQAVKTAPMATGKYYFAPALSKGTASLGVGAMHAVAIDLPSGITLSRIAAAVTGAGTAGSLVRLGIYQDNNGVPGALLLDAGTIDGTSATNQEITISQAISQGGRHWLAACGEVAAPTMRTVTVVAQTAGTLSEAVGSSVFGMCGFATAGGVAAGGLPVNFPAFSFNSLATNVAVKVA